ncbi:hypothetical protein Tco_0784448 [Tanacetum coccineum]
MMMMMTSFGGGDDDGVMWMMASVALAGVTVVVSVGEWWWRNASGGAWVGGSGRSVNGESFLSSPEKPAGKVFRRWWWSPAAGHGRERGEAITISPDARLVLSCFVIFDLEPLSLPFDFVFSS